MAASTLKAFAFFALALPASQGLAAHVEQEAISLDAQSSELDYKNNNLIFRKVRITQGDMSVAADQAQATGLDFENSRWVFRGNVKITMDDGQLTSDEAEITFSKNAWLSDGQNEIRGESLKYNVLAQNIVAESAEQGSQRVHIIITPPANPKP